ncbi:hypothetical protein XENOCAPTIV_029457, partial [Xenoophorus captivus]
MIFRPPMAAVAEVEPWCRKSDATTTGKPVRMADLRSQTMSEGPHLLSLTEAKVFTYMCLVI